MDDALRDMWSSVASFAPKLAAFLVIMIVGWIVAKLVAKAVDKILERVGFDRAVERGGVKRALARSQYDASTIASKIVYYALLLFVLQLAFGVFGPNPISELIAGVIAFLPRLFVALVIVVVASAIAAGVRDLLSNTLSGLSYGRMLANIASVFILGLGVIAALNQVGVAITVTLPVLIAVLATIGGILVVGVGGGLIKPMQQRWDRYLDKAEEESKRIREQVSARDSAEISRSNQPYAPAAPSGYSTQSYQQPPTAAPQPPQGGGYSPTPQQQPPGEPRHGGYQQSQYPPQAPQPGQQSGYGQRYAGEQYPPTGDDPTTRHGL